MKATAESFAHNPVLFGRDNTPAVVSVEPHGGEQVLVYLRRGEKVAVEAQPFQPYLWLTEQVLLQGFDRKVEYEPLQGGGDFKFLARFQSWPDFQAARNYLRAAPFFAANDPAQQYLMATGRTLFKAMHFDQLVRLQVALAGDTILLSDNRGWQHEVRKLDEFVAIVRERDPDVLEGHDIFRVTLPALVARARAVKTPLKLGRDDSAIRSRFSRIQIAEKTIQYSRFEIHGRHIVDTFLLTQLYDIATRELEGFTLEDVAEHFGVMPDVAGIGRISELLSPSFFVQAQIFPYNYQDIVVRGNATKIDALFLREYLHQGHAIPQLGEPRTFAGGYTDVFAEGIVRNVWHCDVQSLYPSLLIAEEIKPRNDELGLFLLLLRDLREFRIRAKSAAKEATEPTQRQHLGALQQTFKILINSFYGYLGFAQAHFGDFDAAEQVTARGRETLKLMLDCLRQRGAHVIEIDTDGLYFVPPPNTESEKLQAELQAALPKGVDVEIDGQFPAMFSYKMKNYVLLDVEEKLHITGSALRSRGLEKFRRQFLEEMLALALKGESKKVPQLYEEFCQKIEQRKFSIELLAKTETLQDSLDVYQQKIAKSARNRNAAYELALKSGRAHQPGNPITYYVTGDSKRVSVYENSKLLSEWNESRRDENVEYYLAKLKALYKKFAPLLSA